MPRTTAPSTNPRILAGYTPYNSSKSDQGSFSKIGGSASTTEERRQLLLSDPYTCDVQPEQVTCTRCSKTVRLQKGKQYHLAHWLDHRWRCDRMESDPQPRERCRTLTERKSYLEADPDAKIVEPDRVVCARCNKDVKLRKGRAYGLSCWTQHKLSCHQQQKGSSSSSSSSSLSASSFIGASMGFTPGIASVAESASGPSSSSAPNPIFALKSDPLVAAIDSNGVKCANCLKWIDLGQIHDLDWHAWRRHRGFCLFDNNTNKNRIDHFSGPSPPPPHPQFLRARSSTIEPIPFVSTSNASTPHPSDSSDDAEEPPRTLEPRPMDFQYQQQLPQLQRHQHRNMSNYPHYNHQAGPLPPVLNNGSRSVSPLSPPPLSFSTVSSASTSVASSPMTSPSFRRKPSLFSNPRHLPLPDCPPPPPPPPPPSSSSLALTQSQLQQQQQAASSHQRSSSPPPVLGLSQLTLGKYGEQRGDKYKSSALGLYFSSSPSRFPSPMPLSPSDLGTSSSSSSSSSRHSSDYYLPPYPERTPIILPIPDRYWRFGSLVD